MEIQKRKMCRPIMNESQNEEFLGCAISIILTEEDTEWIHGVEWVEGR
jgi:hypothetical protein